MFRKEDLPSDKKGGKDNMMFIWIDPEKDGMTKAIMNKLTRRIAN
jgi:hypothetical protein